MLRPVQQSLRFYYKRHDVISAIEIKEEFHHLFKLITCAIHLMNLINYKLQNVLLFSYQLSNYNNLAQSIKKACLMVV